MATRRGSYDARKGNFNFGKPKPEGYVNRNYRFIIYWRGVLCGYCNDEGTALHLGGTLGPESEVRDTKKKVEEQP